VKEHELLPAMGAKKERKRVGRGDGSGHGSYSGRGLKGQKARSGGKFRPGFEGGQLPLIKKLPMKRGFINHFRVQYCVINLRQLGIFDSGTEVTPETLKQAGLIKNTAMPVKILAGGDIDRALRVKASAFSEAAKTKITAAGGEVEVA